MPDLETSRSEQQHALRSGGHEPAPRVRRHVRRRRRSSSSSPTSYDQFASNAKLSRVRAALRRAVRSPAAAGAREGRGARRTTACRSCSSSACTTPVARRWRSAGSTTSRAIGPIVWSGGSEPGTEVNPPRSRRWPRSGSTSRGEFPKPWTDEIVRAADVVVTMGCGDACPLFPGKRYEDWELDDPAGKDVAAVRPIRDEIEQRVRGLLASLDVAGQLIASLQASAARSAARRSGTTRHIIQRPRFSPVSRPASASALVWWLTVGCDLPSGSSRSHEHTSPPAATRLSSRRRTGSPSAAKTLASSSASGSSSGAASKRRAAARRRRAG